MQYCSERISKGPVDFFIIHRQDCTVCKSPRMETIGDFRSPADALASLRHRSLDSYCCYYCCRMPQAPLSPGAVS